MKPERFMSLKNVNALVHKNIVKVSESRGLISLLKRCKCYMMNRLHFFFNSNMPNFHYKDGTERLLKIYLGAFTYTAQCFSEVALMFT